MESESCRMVRYGHRKKIPFSPPDPVKCYEFRRTATALIPITMLYT